ncbi:GTP-binding protein [Thioflexithrix psekupsensis]|uniref:GTP-binding protein n=1 Tax=Thioflexithrix psekupsensis TaxID=1570016 RepID=A0A251X4B3_9GAMM|nr:ATP/GTP-binding protein [Thioflexithrix psekupsensis]OUD12333.1 GTP-binding protein [Thioflexithrix psekupsensis]
MNNYKLIFTGPSGAGKSTAIAALSDIPVVTTEAKDTDPERNRNKYKTTITVALDYGVIKLPSKDKIHLYGTPGQERFNFMWELLTEGGLGLILLIDNARDQPIADLNFFLEAFRDFIHKTKVAIGVTRMDINPKPNLEEYHLALQAHGLNPPLFEVDARRREDVSLLLQALLYTLDPCLHQAELGSADRSS